MVMNSMNSTIIRGRLNDPRKFLLWSHYNARSSFHSAVVQDAEQQFGLRLPFSTPFLSLTVSRSRLYPCQKSLSINYRHESFTLTCSIPPMLIFSQLCCYPGTSSIYKFLDVSRSRPFCVNEQNDTWYTADAVVKHVQERIISMCSQSCFS